MRKAIVVSLILCCLISCIGNAKTLEKRLVETQAENIQLSADISVETKLKEYYKKQYEDEKFWNNVKDIVILIAIVAL